MTITAKQLYDAEAKLLGRTTPWEEIQGEMRWAYEGLVREGLKEGMDLAAMQKACKESRGLVGSGESYVIRVGAAGKRHLAKAGVDLGPLEDE